MIVEWVGGDQSVLLLNNGLLNKICSSAEKNQKVMVIKPDFYEPSKCYNQLFHCRMLNDKQTQTILYLEFAPQDMVGNKHKKGISVAQFFQQNCTTIQ